MLCTILDEVCVTEARGALFIAGLKAELISACSLNFWDGCIEEGLLLVNGTGAVEGRDKR